LEEVFAWSAIWCIISSSLVQKAKNKQTLKSILKSGLSDPLRSETQRIGTSNLSSDELRGLETTYMITERQLTIKACDKGAWVMLLCYQDLYYMDSQLENVNGLLNDKVITLQKMRSLPWIQGKPVWENFIDFTRSIKNILFQMYLQKGKSAVAVVAFCSWLLIISSIF